MSKVVYLDSCVFLGYLNQDSRPEELDGIDELFAKVEANKIQICCSTMVFAEIFHVRRTDGKNLDVLDQLLKPPVILVVPTVQITKHAGVLRRQTRAGKHFISLGDSLHLATAIALKCQAFYTLDKRNKKSELGLIPLNDYFSENHRLEIKIPEAEPSLPGMGLKVIQGGAEQS